MGARPRGRTQGAVYFLAMVRKRRKRHPKMHIYHYAPYEKTALLRLAGRYGVGEDEVDDLLRNGVLVDLYPMVRKSIRVGTANYSLKSLEPLYMGSRSCGTGEVTTATDSITMYASTASCAPRAATTKPPTCSRRSRTTTATTAAPPASCATGCWAARSSGGPAARAAPVATTAR